ncbi:hypothetical protein [Streptomyces sp. NPDC046197]|uniref:hypothetical protein n=1 Tax=Streptomyces sp. NPDC046197 TaxID=3154337 RepID=UPI0033F76E2B
MKCTPGAFSPAVTQASRMSTICRKGGYTKDIWPPASITDKERRLNAASYGYTGSPSDAEYDHDISLQLGGDPNDYRNLWLEPAGPGHKTGGGINNGIPRGTACRGTRPREELEGDGTRGPGNSQGGRRAVGPGP